MASSDEPTYIELRTRLMTIDCSKAFQGLDNNEKLYSYYFSRASWEGAKICYFQRSYEAPALFYLINKIFSLQKLEEVKNVCLQHGFSEDEWAKLTAYLAGFLQNCGNYFSFGDNKFIPEISKEKFWTFIKESEAYKLESAKIEDVWRSIEKEIYEYKKLYGEIGFRDNDCLSSYYSSNMTKDDGKFIQDFLESISVSPLNTRVIKLNDGNYQVLVCSYASTGKVYDYNGKKISLIYGDFSSFMMKLIQNLRDCKNYAANDNQRQMLEHYIQHFYTGDINKHKDSQRVWIKDTNPIIETNLGFIEVYLDPMRVRAEFEGFVAVVDKEQSKKLSNLVENAEKIIANLTWPKEFEIDKFSRPDFTSLDVLSFACSGTPVGINLPNYDDITKTEGFKNVNLGNCYPKPKKEFIYFAKESDIEYQLKYSDESLFVIVALHELLGHGTGKLFKRDKDGKFNFDKENLKHPLTGGPITTFYEENETWGSKFGKVSSGFEECRADSVALYLSCFKESLAILLPGREAEWDDIVYTAWFDLALSGLKGLLYYSVETSEWGQAHIMASYVILQVLLEAGNGFVKIEEAQKEGKPYLYLTLDRNQIHTTGKTAIGNFIRKQQIYKSTADVEEGTKFFMNYAKVDETFLKYRKIVVENKQPRRLENQHDVVLKNGNVEYVSFEESFEGVIKAQMFHYRDSFEDVYPIWKEYRDHFRLKQ